MYASTHSFCCDYVRTLNASGPISKAHTFTYHDVLFFFLSSRLSARILSLGGTAAVALAQGATQTYRLITPELALLATFHPGVFEEHRGLLEYNVIFFREGVQGCSSRARRSGWEPLSPYPFYIGINKHPRQGRAQATRARYDVLFIAWVRSHAPKWSPPHTPMPAKRQNKG
jgi:hypothetical protein